MTVTAITNGKVYNSTSGEFNELTIIIQDKKIHSLNPSGEIPKDADVIDSKGSYITPGLIDACSQIGLRETGIRWEGNDSYEPQLDSAYKFNVVDGIYPFDSSFQSAVSSGVTVAHIVSSAENVVGGKTAVLHTCGKTIEEMMLIDKLGYSFSLGDVPKKAFFEKANTPLTRMGIAQHIRTALSQLLREQSLAETPIFMRCHRKDDIFTALRIAKEYDIKPTLVHATEYGYITNSLNDQLAGVIAGPTFQPIERNELIHLSPYLYKALEDNKQSFAFATDHPTNSIQHLQLEGALAWKNGVRPQTIINGLTKDAAEMLKISHMTGSIKEGLFADLALWNQHPLQLTSKVVQTFIKGKEVYKETETDA